MSLRVVYLIIAGILLLGGVYAAYLRNYPVMAILFVLMGLLFSLAMRGWGNYVR